MIKVELLEKLRDLNEKFSELYYQGRYKEAMELAIETLDLNKSNELENYPDFARTLSNLGLVLMDMGKYRESEDYSKQSMEMRRTIYGDMHSEFAQSLNNLGVLYERIGQYAKAERHHRKALDIYCATLHRNHPRTINSMTNLALICCLLGKYDEAENLYLEALRFRRAAPGDNCYEIAVNTLNLAGLYETMERYQEADSLYREAIEIMRAANLENHPYFASFLLELGNFHQKNGNYKEAEKNYLQAMGIARESFGKDHPRLASIISSLGILYVEMSNFREGEKYLQRAYEIHSATEGADSPKIANTLDSLAMMHKNMGNYDEAYSLYSRSMEIRRKTFGEDNQEYARTLDNMAELLWEMGNYKEAEPLHSRAVDIYRLTLGENSPELAICLHNLATTYSALGKYDDAKRMYLQAMEIQRNRWGEHSTQFAISIKKLADLLYSCGEYSQAEDHYRRSMDILSDFRGENHPDIAEVLVGLAKVLASTYRLDEALEILRRTQSIYDQLIGQIFSFGSESQRMDYFMKIRSSIDIFLSLAFQNENAARVAMDLVLRRKAINVEAMTIQRNAILSGRYPQLKTQFDQLESLKQQIAMKTLEGPGKKGLEDHNRCLDQLHVNKEKIEKELAKQIPEMSLALLLRDVDCRNIPRVLPEGSALVEFFLFHPFDFKAIPANGEPQNLPARYLAIIALYGEPDNLIMIDLGDAAKIDELVHDFRKSLILDFEGHKQKKDSHENRDKRDPERIRHFVHEFRNKKIASDSNRRELTKHGQKILDDLSLTYGIQLCNAIFHPLLRSIGDRKNLLLAPDGELNILPFEILPMGDGKQLFEDYEISYLSTGRDVLRFNSNTSGKNGDVILVVADPDFAFTKKTNQNLMGRHSRDLNPRDYHFSPLPGTRVEGELIGDMFGVLPWLKAAALEGRIKAIKSPKILHIATHGFFLKNQKRNPTLASDASTRLSGPGMENPMLRSGLALAGAQTWLEGGDLPSEAEDGILTAEDVSGIDLLDTELVVISACQTGIGAVQVGEGVFGLRRAFVLAGAKTLIMSLWKVPDLATAILMERFYENLMHGNARGEALHGGQLYVRDLTVFQLRDNWLSDKMIEQISAGDMETINELQRLALQPDEYTPFAHPYYWGAFICQGDSSPLR